METDRPYCALFDENIFSQTTCSILFFR